MKVLSLKLRDDVFEDVERMVKKTKVSRNAYINHAVECFNQLNKRRLLGKKLAQSSKIVMQNSLDVLQDMESLDPHLLA